MLALCTSYSRMVSLRENTQGEWGVPVAAEKRAPIEGGSTSALTGASKILLKTVQVRFF